MDANNKNIASKLPVLFNRVVSSRSTANNTEEVLKSSVGKILQPKNPNINRIGSKIPVISKKVVATKTTPVNTKKVLKSSVGKLLQQKNQNLNQNLNKKPVPRKHSATSMTKLVKNTNRSTTINSKKRISRSFDDIEIPPNTILSSTPSNPCFLQPDLSPKNNRLSISFKNYLNGSSNTKSLDNSKGDSSTTSSQSMSCVEEKSSKGTNKELELLTPTRMDRVDFSDINSKSRTPEIYLISQEEVTLFDITVEDGYYVQKSEHIISSSCSSVDGDKTNRPRKCLGKWENIMNNIERNKLDKKSLPKVKDVKSKVFQRSSNNENCLVQKDRSEKKKCLGTIRNSKEKLCKKPRNDSKINSPSVENDIDTDNAKIIKEDKSNCEHINLLNELKHATKGFDALAVIIQHLVFDLEAYKVPDLKQSLATMKFNYAKLNEDCEKLRQHPSNTSSSSGASGEQEPRSPKLSLEKKTVATEVINTKHNFDDYKHLITKNENEIKSLQTVLDIKMVEMNDLRLKANNLQRENEQLQSVATKVPYLESRIQKLEVQLSNKANKEQNLLLENKKKDEELTLQINRNQDQARIIEQLRYKLKRRSETNELLYCPESPLKSSNSNRNSVGSLADSSLLRGRDSTMYYSISDNSQVPFSSPESPRVKSYVEKSASASWVLEIDDIDDFISPITNNSGNNGIPSESSVSNSRSKSTSLSYSKK